MRRTGYWIASSNCAARAGKFPLRKAGAEPTDGSSSFRNITRKTRSLASLLRRFETWGVLQGPENYGETCCQGQGPDYSSCDAGGGRSVCQGSSCSRPAYSSSGFDV